jgi:hypothetical protein
VTSQHRATAAPAKGRTRTCAIEVDTVVRARFLPGSEVSLDDARENLETTARLSQGKRLPVMVDLRGVRSQSAEARALLAGPAGTAVSVAVAMIIASPLSRVLGNFYLGFNRPETPTRLFTSQDEAEAWLSSFIETGNRE